MQDTVVTVASLPSLLIDPQRNLERMTEACHRQQEEWFKVHRARAYDHNIYVLLNNAVGPSTEGLEGGVANHAGTLMGVDPSGEVFLRTSVEAIEPEVVTVTLEADKKRRNHSVTRNRRPHALFRMLERTLYP